MFSEEMALLRLNVDGGRLLAEAVMPESRLRVPSYNAQEALQESFSISMASDPCALSGIAQKFDRLQTGSTLANLAESDLQHFEKSVRPYPRHAHDHASCSGGSSDRRRTAMSISAVTQGDGDATKSRGRWQRQLCPMASLSLELYEVAWLEMQELCSATAEGVTSVVA